MRLDVGGIRSFQAGQRRTWRGGKATGLVCLDVRAYRVRQRISRRASGAPGEVEEGVGVPGSEATAPSERHFQAGQRRTWRGGRGTATLSPVQRRPPRPPQGRRGERRPAPRGGRDRQPWRPGGERREGEARGRGGGSEGEAGVLACLDEGAVAFPGRPNPNRAHLVVHEPGGQIGAKIGPRHGPDRDRGAPGRPRARGSDKG